MSVLFDNVKVGDTVHYSTPQGQSGKGKVVIHKGTHLVLNAGGKHGRPQVVTDKNYIKHSRDGKVVGALLSRLRSEAYIHVNGATSTTDGLAKKHGGTKHTDTKTGSIYKFSDGVKATQFKKKVGDAHRWAKHEVDSLGEEVITEGNIPKVHSWDEFHQAAQDWAYYNDHHNGGKPKYYKKTTETDKVLHQTISIGHHPRSGNPYVIGVFNHIGGPNSDKGHGTHHHYTQGLELDEDSHDLEGKSSRVAKTKRLKKKLHELDNSTLASYVTKALKDRKNAKSGFDMAGRIWDGERKDRAQANAFKRIDKRTVGIQRAVGKIANNLPAVKEGIVTEVSAPGKEAWIKANKSRFIAKYGKEKGLRVLYAKAWKDAKVSEAKIQKYTTDHGEYRITSTTGPAGHSMSVEKDSRVYAQKLGGKVLGANGKPLSKKDPVHAAIAAHTNHPEVKKFLGEARNEYDANIQMAQSSQKTAKGHYLMRDGRKLSGPHSPEEAVKAYKGLAAQGTDTKGVKIVHVKEGVEVDVTAILMEGASAMAVASLMNQKKPGQDKVKKAAEKAISLAKKAKGNKHVDTEPKLEVADKGTGGPMEGSHEQDGEVRANV
jgi:hypothetical protein